MRRGLTRKRRPTCVKIEGLSPAPCHPLWGKQGDGIHLMSSQLQKLTGSAIDSQTRAFCGLSGPFSLLAASVAGFLALWHGSALPSAQLLLPIFYLTPKAVHQPGPTAEGLLCHTLKFNSCLTTVFNVTLMFKCDLVLAPPQGRGSSLSGL